MKNIEAKKEQESFYITTAIHYANAGPHVGHAYEGVLADIIARYERSVGRDTFFLSGTDEHGQKIVRAAESAGVGPQAFVDQNAEKFKKLYEKLHLSNDAFIRTSDKKTHWPGAEALWKRLEEAGDIYKGTYTGLYCVGCESFITERELVDGKCPDHNEPPQEVKEENYFFRASKYQDELKQKIVSDEILILPKERKAEVLSFLADPLTDPSFSRPEGVVPWGIPVPNDPKQMMYVWCDALSNYISALGFGTDDDAKFQKFWPANVHVIGKDILRFHAVFWPAMLLSAELPTPRVILVHGHITSEGRKMSKSIGNVIDPEMMIEKYGAPAFRHYLGHEVSPFQDGDFTEEKFVESYNGNLAHGIGNLLSRTVSMAVSYFEGAITSDGNVSAPLRQEVGLLAGQEAPTYHIPYYFDEFILPDYQTKMDAFEVNRALDTLWHFAGVLDGYITDYEPFKLIKTDKVLTEQVLWDTLYGIWKIAELLEPFMPEISKKMIDTLGTEQRGEKVTFSCKKLKTPLFQKIEK